MAAFAYQDELTYISDENWPEEYKDITWNFRLVGKPDDYDYKRERMNQTIKWREENNVNNILEIAQPKFQLLKEIYPVYFHGYDKSNNIVLYQMLGNVKNAEIIMQNVKANDLLNYFYHYQEYCWNVISRTRDETRGVLKMKKLLILDLSGFALLEFTSEVASFVNRLITEASLHWPGRSFKTLITNPPIWFSTISAAIYPFLSEQQRSKLIIQSMYTTTLDFLKEYIEEENIPNVFGGTGSNCQLKEDDIEKKYYEFVESVNKEKGVEFIVKRVEEEQPSEKKEVEEEGSAASYSIFSLMG